MKTSRDIRARVREAAGGAMVAAVLLSGCSLLGDEAPAAPDGDSGASPETGADTPTVGVYVGAIMGTDTLVAVVSSPPADGSSTARVSVYVGDGKRVSEHFQTSAEESSFSVDSADGDATVDGEIGDAEVTGTLSLSDGEELPWTAARAAGASGLYNLTVSPNGTLSGATPAGVGITGTSPKEPPGNGRLDLADGQQLSFTVARSAAKDGAVDPGEVILIVTADGDVVGAGRSPGSGSMPFLVRGR